MVAFFIAVILQTAFTYAFVASFICLLAAAELAFPRARVLSRDERRRVIIYMALYIPVAMLISAMMFTGLREAGLYPILSGLGVAGVVLAAVAGDFLYYWYHRAQHAIPWLWRIHSVHHSPEELGAGSGYHHLLEAPLKALFVSLPLALLIQRSAAPLLVFFLSIHSYYVHSGTRLNFGKLAWVICDNRVHRIHHSLDPDHFNRNFGVLTLLWDRMFGTARFPQTGEWPAVGLDDLAEPRSVADWVRLPPDPTLKLAEPRPEMK